MIHLRQTAKLRPGVMTLVLTTMTASIACLATDHPSSTRSAEAQVNELKDALFLSTRDYTADGRRTVDLYWESSKLIGAKSIDQSFYDKLHSLYGNVQGDRILRAELTDSGWSVLGPRAALVLALDEPSTGLLVLISNRTPSHRIVTTEIQGAASRDKRKWELEPGETAAFTPAIKSNSLGVIQTSLLLSSQQEQTKIMLPVEVRPAVRFRLRILDASGSRTPARAYVRGADSLSHTPTAILDRVMWMTGEHYFYTSGSFDLVLPAGKTRIEVRKGFEYEPVIRELELSAPEAELEINLKLVRDMKAAGWYGGDDHIHGNYTGKQSSTPADDLLVVRAEGLGVGNMMVSNSTGGTIHDESYFEGRPNPLSSSSAILYWNQEMRTWSYGHLLLLNLKHLVRPLYTGFPDAEYWEDYPSNYSKEQAAHAQGGVTLYAHPALRFDDIPEGSLAAESVVDVALGGIDSMEVFCSHDEPSMELWYRFLNLGFRLGIAAGSDAFLNQRFAFLAGGERVYVYTGKPLNYSQWMEGLRHGRSFATVGPLLEFQVSGQAPGAEKRIPAGGGIVPVQISVVSTIPISRAEVVENGRVVAAISSPKPTHRLEWQGSVNIDQSAWLAARVWGPDNDRIANGPSRWSQRRSPTQVLLAHSSPSFIYVGRGPIFSEQDRNFCLRWLDSLVERISSSGKFASDAHRNEVLATFERARQVYEHMGTTVAEAYP